MKKSALTYELVVDEELEYQPNYEARITSNQLRLNNTEDGEYTLDQYSISEKGQDLLAQAREAYKEEKFSHALKLYKRLHESDPQYHHALTLIADMYYIDGDYDKAVAHFLQSIDANFIAYDAHWFLADTYWKTDEHDLAMRHMTIAHLLNYHHENIKKRLIEYREAIGRPWKEWAFEPLFRLEENEEGVTVTSHPDWLGYAMVKAVWAYEPGYGESMAGPDYERHIVNTQEEKEALAGLITATVDNDSFDHLRKIFKEGFFAEFFFYELLARQAPLAILMLPRELFLRTIDYIDHYH